mmetsp:Transcript_90557/g.255657  ORF Transcript_90557/g.255657 Transcript_90557/m.255657 type:complete len:208 (-) Transcript_90557:3-626(-)
MQDSDAFDIAQAIQSLLQTLDGSAVSARAANHLAPLRPPSGAAKHFGSNLGRPSLRVHEEILACREEARVAQLCYTGVVSGESHKQTHDQVSDPRVLRSRALPEEGLQSEIVREGSADLIELDQLLESIDEAFRVLGVGVAQRFAKDSDIKALEQAARGLHHLGPSGKLPRGLRGGRHGQRQTSLPRVGLPGQGMCARGLPEPAFAP